MLPLAFHKEEGAEEIAILKMRTSRFPVKRMFMRVVTRPRPQHNFDGKILLERVSEKVKLVRRSSNHNFSPDLNINS